ncbi:hypothetical protein [Microbacterium sp. zg.Y909]|uniref:hypothetical protein n=1 Tax=Microbacterium sp. zg.Y909 TaxID=2969413 RepID=UPI00214A99A8|nr:hypothetical protein [Microbacterium sp. zg.Y909]MCR2826708.1 hypothetical protein [Microbacterium sp. zg.Y909]
MKKIQSAAVLAAIVILSGCSGEPALEVSAAPPSVEVSQTPTPAPTPDAERGTRGNPLAVGESRKLSVDSMWSLGAAGPTEIHDGYLVLPMTIALDWDAGEKQAQAEGLSLRETGVDPWASLFVEYVSAGGRSFATMDDYSVDIPDDMYNIGTLYPPVESVGARVAVSVPADQVPGGVWVVKNAQGSAVFIATE